MRRERVTNCARRYVGAEQSSAQPLQQNEMDAPAPCLLVDPYQLLHGPRSDPYRGCRKPCALQQRTDAGRVGLRKKPELPRQAGRRDHPRRYGLAMQPSSMTQAGFDGAAEGMSDVNGY